jgi:sugar lactone lactonase YvrE
MMMTRSLINISLAVDLMMGAVTVAVCARSFAPVPTAALTVAATTAQAAACVGDCDNSGSVTVDEIVTGVNIALDSLSLDQCPRFDCNGSARVTIDCVIAAVNAALSGCSPEPTASVTRSPTPTVTGVDTPTSTPTMTQQSVDHFVDNGDGTITDTQTGLIWEKKDQGGGLHDVNTLFPWAGVCTDDNGVPCTGVIGCELCQPDAAAASTCGVATGDATGCAQCSGAAICQPINGLTTVWQWLNQLNASGFAGHNDWRLPTVGRDGGAAQLETIVDTSASGCGSGVPCVTPAFNTECASGCTATSCSCTNIGQYWSATSIAETLPLPSVWSVLFFRGNIIGADKTSDFFPRAVRSVACGTFLAKFGRQGSAEGQFHTPEGLAVDVDGNVFVADSGNHRIEKFTRNGIFLLQWGSQGSGEGQFFDPEAVAVDQNGNVFVADSGNHRIEKFTRNGIFLLQWGSMGSAQGQFHTPDGLAVDADGNAFVADLNNNRIEKFDNDGTFLTSWGDAGDGDGQLSGPAGVAVDRSQNVYVADFFNDRIQKFTSTGTFLTKWGSTGSGDAQFIGARGVAVGASGTIFTVDDGNDRIEEFTARGVFLATWGGLGNADGQFNSATAVAVDPNGTVWVSDQNPRVQRFACPAPHPG